jgi:anti-sigma B factor antagonist/stage II sporulation protein AA (anti-sigma F factor antagonist)
MARLADLVIEEVDGNALLARVRGEVDASNAAELRMAIVERLSNDTTGLILDFSQATYLDSTGIALLFELARGLSARRQTLRLAVPPDAPIRRVVDLCDVGSVAAVDDAPADSLAAFSEPE